MVFPILNFKIYKQNFTHYLLPFFFTFNLFLFSISNINNQFIFILKLFLSIVNLLVSISLFIKKKIVINNNILYNLIFVAFIGLSLTYSLNQVFGLKKFILVLNIIPFSIFGFYIFTSDKSLKNLTEILVLIFTPLILISIIIQPFNTDSIYEFSFTRWSHVFFSRFVGITFILVLFSRFKNKTFIILILYFGMLFNGARGPLIFITALLFFYYLLNIKIEKKNLFVIFSVFCLFVIFYFIFLNKSNERILNLININEFLHSGGIQVRLEAWEKAINIFLNNLILGVGIGGFNTNLFSNIGDQIVYPHNILLEILCELGLIGFTLFILIITNTYKFLKVFSLEIKILFWFSLYLALFSKDLSSNPLLFSFSFFYIKKINNRL